MVSVRGASAQDVPAIASIYNQGIEDGVATLEYAPKTLAEMGRWFEAHDERYAVLAACAADEVVGWASLNSYSHRCAYDGVADLSIYIRRDWRNRGVGRQLLQAVEAEAVRGGFHKIVLFALSFNDAGRRLYAGSGFREVGVFVEQGKLDGRYVDVLIMEKLVKTT